MSFIKAKDLDKIKRSYLEEIKNPKYEDLLTVGNIVEFYDDTLRKKIYYGIVIDKITSRILVYNNKKVILTPNTEHSSTYWDITYFKKDFPIYNDGTDILKIQAIYKCNEDISEFKTHNDFYTLFKILNLKTINE